MDLQALPMGTAFAVVAPAVVLGGLFVWFITWFVHDQKGRKSPLPPLPVVPGLPVIGNMLQLREKKPHITFAKWAKTYGPIYSIKTGSNKVVVLNNDNVAKEAMITRFSSITTRKLPKAISMLSHDKCMVALSDYDDFHKTIKRHILTNVLGVNAQKRHRGNRDTFIANIVKGFHAHVKDYGLQPVNFRNIFEPRLFGLGLKKGIGIDVESIYVEELGKLSKDDMFKILAKDPMDAAATVDWRDYFPSLNWIPNRTYEKKIEELDFRKQSVMKALIKEGSKQVDSGEGMNCYLNYLLTEGKTLTDKQKTMLVWEVIIETADTTLITAEWAMYELAKNPKLQDRLYQEIRGVCGHDKITEEELSQLPYLSAIFHETLRKHSPAPVLPLRFAHEDTELGGYFVPAGSEIAINLYGCNMDENRWEKPEEWNPERFLQEKYKKIDMHKTMAFGAGRRVCAGSLQAMLIACSTIGRLVQEFEWRLKDGEKENIDIAHFTNQKLHPMHAIIWPRI